MKQKTKDSKPFLRIAYNNSFEYLNKSKKFIYLSVFFFVVFVFLGFLIPVPSAFETKILDYITELLLKTKGMSYFELIRFIFLNNSEVSFLGIFLGIFIGIFPLTALVFNGYILGFIASKFAQAGSILVLWKLIPHGIFELPAVFISMGLGLRLGIPFIYRYFKYYLNNKNILAVIFGIFLLFPSIILTLIFNKKLRKEQFFDFKFKVLNSLKIFILIVITFFIIAAFIEGSLIFLFND